MLLNLLLDKYERSLTYSGENQVNQSFSVKPAEIYPGYESNYEPVDAVRRFEDEVKQLEKAGLVRIVWKRESITRIILGLGESGPKLSQSAQAEQITIPEGRPLYDEGTASETRAAQLEEIYVLLHRTEKNDRLRQQREFYEAQIDANASRIRSSDVPDSTNTSPIIDAFCREQLDRIAAGKNSTYELDEAATILRLLRQILGNRSDILERELSISVFGDSKTFEKSWRSRICRILEKYGDFGNLLEGIDNRREREIVLLEEFGIYANPSYIYVKGRGKITFADGKVCETAADRPIALSSAAVRDIDCFEIADRTIMTVENLTSFNRVSQPGTFFLFLSGYHNTLKQRLLLKIYRDNFCEDDAMMSSAAAGNSAAAASASSLIFLHFGDIDPDGFLILRHLREETGIDFRPYRMGIDELKKYRKYCKPLEQNDVTKAKNLLETGQFEEEMRYMLNHNVKLEQEIISWMEDIQ